MGSPITSAVQQLNATVRNMLARFRGSAPDLESALIQQMQLTELAARHADSVKNAPPGEVRATPRADLFVRLPGVVAIAGAGAAGNPNSGPMTPIQWPFSGYTVGVSVGCMNETTQDLYLRSMAATDFSITVSSVENLVVDGQGQNYFPFVMATPPNSPILPIRRRFAQGETWQVQFRNLAGAGVTITPALVFHVRLDRLAAE